MGRTKKYETDEERLIANREKSLRYYHKNKENINKQKMVEYYERQIREMEEKLSELWK